MDLELSGVPILPFFVGLSHSFIEFFGQLIQQICLI